MSVLIRPSVKHATIYCMRGLPGGLGRPRQPSTRQNTEFGVSTAQITFTNVSRSAIRNGRIAIISEKEDF